VVVAAAGNGGPNASPSYPAADPNDRVIAVAAIASDESIASFSQAGSYVDIAAPGVGIMSTVPTNAYSSYSGTSMAAPHVAGVAALAFGKAPTASVAVVRSAILAGARDLGAAGRDNTFGTGAVDARNTLALITTGTPTTTTTTTVAPTTTTTAPVRVPGAPTNVKAVFAGSAITLTWTAPVANPAAPVVDYRIQYTSNRGATWQLFNDAVSPATSASITGLTTGSTYQFRVAAINSAGMGQFSSPSALVKFGTATQTTTTTVPRSTTTTVPRSTTTTVPRSTTTTIAPTLAAPPLFKATINDTHLMLTASSVKGAATYQLQRNGVLIGTASRPSFFDLDRATIAGTYTYTLRAVTSTGAMGAAATTTFTVTPPTAPTLVSSSVKLRSLTVRVSLTPEVKTWQLLRNGIVVARNAASRTTISVSQPIGTGSYTLRSISLTGATNSTTPFVVTIAR
jgi:predicted phage tail protein